MVRRMYSQICSIVYLRNLCFSFNEFYHQESMKNLSIVLTQIAMHDHLYSWNNILTFKFIDWNWKWKNVIITLSFTFYITLSYFHKSVLWKRTGFQNILTRSKTSQTLLNRNWRFSNVNRREKKLVMYIKIHKLLQY